MSWLTPGGGDRGSQSCSASGTCTASAAQPSLQRAETGQPVSFESIPGATGGWCDQKAGRVVVDSNQPANAQLRILIHETIHGLGVGTSGETVPYVAGWAETGALEAVNEFAQLIDTLARRVEAAIKPIDDVKPAPKTFEQPLQGACI